MGSVYLAHEVATERTVAIKFLHRPGEPTAYDRFLVEVRALTRLDHPNVVRVFAVDTNWREPYFTMEYAAGGTLADLVADGRAPPDPAEAARLILTAAGAVAAAHVAGILHRDLKPSNILLGSRERGVRGGEPGPPLHPSGSDSAHRIPNAAFTPKVSDFGLAKRLDRDDGLTRTGPLGTPAYMSPEAAEGRFRDVGPPADVYGLGATLYHLLTGRPPFSGRTPAEVIARVVGAVPERPRAVRPEVPAALEAVVVRAMEKDPAKRYATVEDFADDLRRVLAGQRPSAPVLTRRRRAWRWLTRNRKPVGLALLAAAALATGVWAATHTPVREQPSGGAGVGQPSSTPPTAEQLAEVRLAEVRETLAGGKPVTLVGATGLPKYHRFPLEPCTLTTSGDGTCVFDAPGYGLLELGPDLGLNHYRVDLEVRQLRARADGEPVDTGRTGLYFGYGTSSATGATAHALFAATFQDFVPTPPRAVQAARLERFGFLRSPAGLRATEPSAAAELGFRPSPAPPGEWRRVSAAVTPTHVHVEWEDAEGRGTLASWTGERTEAHYRGLRSGLRTLAPAAGANLPGWSPRMPFGVVAYKSSVALRKVVVTPLDPSAVVGVRVPLTILAPLPGDTVPRTIRVVGAYALGGGSRLRPPIRLEAGVSPGKIVCEVYDEIGTKLASGECPLPAPAGAATTADGECDVLLTVPGDCTTVTVKVFFDTGTQQSPPVEVIDIHLLPRGN
jgi:hypothetical protein